MCWQSASQLTYQSRKYHPSGSLPPPNHHLVDVDLEFLDIGCMSSLTSKNLMISYQAQDPEYSEEW